MLALGAALKEVGVGTEVAATGLNALVTKISTPDDGFDEALVSAGLNAKKFRKAVEKDATGAILILLKALDKAQGTKRLSILKDMFGMEYADDMSRLVGALPRVLKLLDLANDKQKALGSVRAGAALAMEKDFNRLDRATQSIDVMMKRTGDTMKVVAGQFAEFINEAVDSAEKAERRLRRLREIDADTAEREGKMPSPSKGGPTAAEQEDRVLKGIAAGQYDEDTLRYVVTHAPTERARQAAEDEYRRQRYARSDRQKAADEANHWDLFQTYRDSSLNKGGLLNGPARRQSAKELAKAEEIRILRMQREFGDMYRIPTAQAGLERAQTGLGSLSRLGSFGTLPITLGKGKGAKTYAAPTLDASGFDGIKAKVDEVTEGVMALGPSLASGLTSGFSTMEAEALAAIARIQQAINNLRPPSLSFGGGGGPGGFNTGKQGPN
ncbi:MAG: phage tail tape measure protein [Chelatococcus sp.]|nr:MAG: phage tail tape measure protein [Chelatococcus sp.]